MKYVISIMESLVYVTTAPMAVIAAFSLSLVAAGQGMNSVALFLLRTAGGREELAFWLLDALATAVIPGHWEQLSHIATAGAGVVTIRWVVLVETRGSRRSLLAVLSRR